MKKCEKIIAVILLLMVLSISIFYGKGILKSSYHALAAVKNGTEIEEMITQFNEEYRNCLTDTREWINFYGFIQKSLGKREIKNFSIVCDDQGYLYTQTSEMTEEKVENTVEDVEKLYEKTKDVGGDFLFVQMPYKNYSSNESLEGYGIDYTESNYNRIVAGVNEKQIPCFDLRDEKKEWEFFRTDHHWTVNSAFRASTAIVTELNKQYEMGLDESEELREVANYYEEKYPNSLLGSTGIQVGEYYTKKDDFDILLPCFETNLQYSHYVSGNMTAQFDGDFQSAFINEELLKDKNYYNKYNACLYGGWNENHVINYKSENDLKCLLVTNSYGRPMTQYLSLYFKELRYLDPQPGRYNDNYVVYIQEYQPDVVIIMYDDEINTGD